MTQNGIVNKTDTLDALGIGRREFFAALYKGSPDELYLELRCIHAITGEARSLWGQMGNQRELATALKQAEVLNREGFGVYFAPCLRKAKQGNAEAAALIPTLWIDIDCNDDRQKREKALTKLLEFEPAPSFILDSGGGWHGYWLLDDPFRIQSEADRQKIAGILRGLFAALGGDSEYVKTVAGIMRLPDSINTKPDRGGVIVKLVEYHPERRFSLTQFDWLEAKLIERIGHLQVVNAGVNGRHMLSKRTENYLASGALEGSRNTELFAATCQFRDAGYTQSEAEVQLVRRYVLDGGSEREALTTIQSAYTRSPREPIQQQGSGREQIDCLVSRYGRKEDESERPSVDEVRQAVKACADLDPLEWAEERKRIRSIAGDTFRTEDLNRMYQQARRDQSRNKAVATASAGGCYLEGEQSIIYEKQTERGSVRQPVTDWTARIAEWVTRIDDDGQEEHLMRTQLQHPMHTTTLDIPGELFGDANALARFIAQRAGGVFTVYPAMHRHLPHAIQSLSGTFPRRTIYRFVGWAQHERHWVYLSPGLSVSATGKLTEPPEVELETRLCDYGLGEASWTDSLNALTATLDVFPKSMAGALTAFALLPLVQRFFPPAATRPALHLVGTTGSGKSEIAAFMTSFYGRFTRDTPPAQWGDTVNTVEVLGYALADGLFWVDDWKPCYSDERTFTRFLQSYSRGMGRGRLTKDAKVRQERPCRGLLLSTGETTIEGEASILARMLVLEIPPWEKRDPGGKRLAQAEKLREALPGFTAHFIRWLATKIETGTLAKEMAQGYESSVKGYRDMLNAKLSKQANTGRVISNWAVLVTVYHLLQRFLAEHDCDEVLPAWQDNLVETAKAVQEERAGQVFIDTLGQLLASGDVRLTNLESNEESKSVAPIIGYEDRHYLYLLPEIALREVRPTQSLNFTTKSIGDQLREDGWLLPSPNDGRLTVQRRFRGHRAWVWCLKREVLDDDTGDSGDAHSVRANEMFYKM